MKEFRYLTSIIAGLKKEPRVGWNEMGRSVPSPESDADHSFGVAMLALWVALNKERFPEVDPFKIVAYALVHDMVEVLTHDSGAHHQSDDPVEKIRLLSEKKQREESAIRYIREQLGPVGVGFENLWLEFENGTTPEARLAKDLDRIETAAQAFAYHEDGHRSDPDRFYSWASELVKDARLGALFEGAFGFSVK